MKKFSVIIPCHKHAHLLSKCIGSVYDNRDWKEKEVIVILDPYDAEAEKILKTFPDVKWTITDMKQNQGAPKARNMGASLATGDYLIFCDADMEIFPGSLRTYAEAFEEHPECGFVYAGYKIGDNSYPSEEFDPYFLYINNYIDGNFPIRKEVFEPWDEKLKSLQDWELWIRLVKKGVKGHYLKDQYFFHKELPGAGSISHDSDKNWLERKKKVQKKHNLPIRDIAMTSFAAIHHARRCAKLLDFDYVDPIILTLKPHEYKAVYLVGSFPANELNNIIPFMNRRVNPPQEVKGIKKIRHWIGTDVLQMQSIAHGALTGFVKMLNEKFIHFCQSEANLKELKEMGINAKLCPLPVDTTHNGSIPYPKKFTVAIYDHGMNDMYCQPLMVEVIKSMPDINFITFGSPLFIGKSKDLKNFEFLGHIPINEVIAKTNILLRITKHDGFPVSPIEFLCAERAVITNQDFPYMEKIDGNLTEKGVIEMKKNIMHRIRKIKRHYPKQEFFDMARKHYTRILNPNRLRNEVMKCL